MPAARCLAPRLGPKLLKERRRLGINLRLIDLAFSRDQGQKVYVQNRLKEKGRDVYAWLEGGGHLYVCGDATRMAPDVHNALIDIVATHGGKSTEDAKAYLESLREQQRYQRDVY